MTKSRKESYEVPVNGIDPRALPAAMKRALVAAARELPAQTGVIVFAFDFGAGGGMAYASNAERSDCIAALEEWIRHQRTLS